LIDLFENLVPEKPLLRALRKVSPNALSQGYQHAGGIPRELLSYFLTHAEWQSGVFPDQIVVNSSFSRDQLRDAGISERQIVLGPAYRFQYLERLPLHQPSRQARVLLLLLPLDLNSALEMTERVRSAAEELRLSEIRVWVKAHPMFKRSGLAAIGALPSDWLWVTDELVELMPRVGWIVGENSVLLDAAASAVPFIAWERELQLSYNPLWIWQERFSWCRPFAPKELEGRFVEVLLRQASEYESERRELAQEIRHGFSSAKVWPLPERLHGMEGAPTRSVAV
jgi:hypothetical protein